jgi:AcrR family transcriptional regulator
MRKAQDNAAYRKTELRIIKALTHSFSKNDPVFTKVRKVLTENNISPAAFYVHYESLPDLITKSQQRILRGINIEVRKASNDKTITLERFYRNVLLFFFKNKEYVALVVESRNIRIETEVMRYIRPYITSYWNKYNPETNDYIYQQLALNFIAEVGFWHNERYDFDAINRHAKNLASLTMMAPRVYSQMLIK